METHKPKLMIQSDFAREAGVDTSTIHRHMLKRLKNAVVGNQIDANHPDAIDYLVAKKTGVDPSPKQNTRIKERLAEAQAFRVPDDLEAFADKTLRELIEEFGTDTRFKDWLDATKKIEDIESKRLANAQTKRNLVAYQLVSDHVVSTYTAAHLDLLQNGSMKIAFTLDGMSKSDANLAQMEDAVIDIITGILTSYQDKIVRVLKEMQE